jgi:hypothetical protein
MIDMPDDVADAVDSEDDAYITWWNTARPCERCGRSERMMLALISSSTGEERLYCEWNCIAPPELDENDADQGAVESLLPIRQHRLTGDGPPTRRARSTAEL